MIIEKQEKINSMLNDKGLWRGEKNEGVMLFFLFVVIMKEKIRSEKGN